MDERSRLLKGVQRWFDHPQQVAHYAEEQPTGLTAAEAWLCESLPPSQRVLDVGCGAGRAALALARQGHTVVATDVSRALLDVAANVAARQQLPLTCIQTGALELPLADGCVDAVLAFKVFGYIPTRAGRRQFLSEVARVLHSSGVVLLTFYVVPLEGIAQAEAERDPQLAAQFTTLEPGDTFTLGEDGGAFVHWFAAEALREELAASGMHLDVFTDDKAYGGDGFVQLARLRR